jgi:hypothetical protein
LSVWYRSLGLFGYAHSIFDLIVCSTFVEFQQQDISTTPLINTLTESAVSPYFDSCNDNEDIIYLLEVVWKDGFLSLHVFRINIILS